MLPGFVEALAIERFLGLGEALGEHGGPLAVAGIDAMRRRRLRRHATWPARAGAAGAAPRGWRRSPPRRGVAPSSIHCSSVPALDLGPLGLRITRVAPGPLRVDLGSPLLGRGQRSSSDPPWRRRGDHPAVPDRTAGRRPGAAVRHRSVPYSTVDPGGRRHRGAAHRRTRDAPRGALVAGGSAATDVAPTRRTVGGGSALAARWTRGSTRRTCPSMLRPPTGLGGKRRRAPPGGGALASAKSGGVLLSQGVYPQVPSALTGLTSVFGMGTGVTLSLWPPKSVVNRCADAH